MKNLRFLAIFAAFGFVVFQIYNLNSKVREEAELSSLIEVYEVTSNDTLSLRKGPSTNAEILTKLNGKNSGNPAQVILVSKEKEDWWKVQFTDENEKIIQGYVSSEYLKPTELIEMFSLFWDENNKFFEESDSDACEKASVPFTESELMTFELSDAPYMLIDVFANPREGAEKMKLFSGALLRRTQNDGELRILSNPVTLEEEKNDELAPVNYLVKLSDSGLVSLKDKQIVVPELSKHIEDKTLIADKFEVETDGDKYMEYNCCFKGKACEKFVKLLPQGDVLREVLMLPYEKKSVYEKLQVTFKSEDVAKENEEGETSAAEDAPLTALAISDAEGVDYTNYEEYFLGPKGVKNRTGGDVYRLNVKASKGTVKDGPCGSYHYNPENFGGLVGGDRYIKKEVLGCFLATLQVFKKKYPNEKIQWGDISRGDRTSFRPDHRTHKDGRDIDVRPIRSDDKLLSCNIGKKANAGCYNRKITKAFIDIALKFGGNPVYFNDSKVNKTNSKIKYSKGHFDHFHIRYSRTCTGVTLNTKYCPREGFN